MSTGGTSPLGNKPRNISMQFMFSILVGIGIVLYLMYTFGYSADSFFMQNRPTTAQTAEPNSQPKAETPPSKEVDPKAAERALADVRVAQARERISQTRGQLQRLKQQHAVWQSRSASVLGGDPGRRIAGSTKHLNLAAELLDREPTSNEALLSWDQQLNALASPLESGLSRPDLTPDFLRTLNDLSQQIADTLSQVERRLQLVEALTQETSTLPPAELTLEQTLRNRQTQAVRAEAERLAAIRAKARQEGEEENAKRVAALEREVVQAEAKRKEQTLQAEKTRIDELAESEKRQAAEEAKVRAAQQRAIELGLKAEATRVEDAIKEAQLERDYQRDLADIKSYLSPFISEGFVRRKTGKGPMSLSYLKGQGALAETSSAINTLQALANGTNDRPLGAFPSGFGTKDLPGINKAAELLRKYGDLLVKKGLLDK